MKVETEKEILFERLNKNKIHNCENHKSFSEYLEKSIEKNKEELKLMEEIEEIKRTSIFAEKKTGKRRNDIFDTLIDI